MEDGLALELELAEAEPDRFIITVRSPAGEETGELNLDAVSVLGQRSQLQSTVLASAVTSRRALSEVEGPVRQVGELLFNSLFSERVYGAYKASLALTQQQGLPLRIVLRTQVPELAALPWEMLYDVEAGAYLCQRDPLVRHVAVSSPTRPLAVHPPLRVLGMVSAPRDKQRLDVTGEKHRLSTALSGLGERVQLRWVGGGSWEDLQRELVSGSWHVVHYIGHGGFDIGRSEGVLALEDEDGMSELVGADRFSQLLTTQVPPPQLVVLNSCAGAQAAADDLFSSTAAALVRAGVSASVAMQFAVSDPAAKAFAAGFYQAIAHNHSIADAVRIGRIGIRGTSEDTLEWVTPALYLRGNDAPLFNVLRSTGSPGESTEAPSPEQAALQAGAQALYQQAMSHFRAGRYGDAVALFDSLLSLQPGYRDAEGRRSVAAVRQQARDAFDGAREAEDRGDWDAAILGYGEALRLQPDYPDAGVRQKRCQHERVVADLFDELRQHTNAQDWVAAGAVADELLTLSPAVHDPAGLIAQARAASSSASVAEPVTAPTRGVDWTSPVSPEPPVRRRLVLIGLAVLTVLAVIGGVAGYVRLSGGKDAPEDRIASESPNPSTSPRMDPALAAYRALPRADTALGDDEFLFTVRNEQGEDDIYRGDLQGDAEPLLNNQALMETFPNVSPNGKSFIYLRGKDATRTNLWVAAVDGTDEDLLFERDQGPCLPGWPGPAAWSPDGTHLALACHKQDGSLKRGLVIVGLDDGAETTVFDRGMYATAPGWSSDNRIAYERRRTGGTMEQMDAADAKTVGGELHIVKYDDDKVGSPESLGVTGHHPAWSNDGKYLAFQRRTSDGRQDVYLWRLDSRAEPTPLPDTDETQVDPTWSPVDSDRLVVIVGGEVKEVTVDNPDELVDRDQRFGSDELSNLWRPAWRTR
jgi:tetratricopeptide (TPR) repeat protein